MGLITPRDRLCLVQLSDGSGDEHLVRFAPGSAYDAPNLKALLIDPARIKIFHFARFDIAAMQHYLGVLTAPIYCTKTASRLVRTYTDRHGLKELVRELLGQEMSKVQQSSDWGGPVLSEGAARLCRLRRALSACADGRTRPAAGARRPPRRWPRPASIFCPHRALLDLAGWPEIDIFAQCLRRRRLARGRHGHVRAGERASQHAPALGSTRRPARPADHTCSSACCRSSRSCWPRCSQSRRSRTRAK